MKPMIRTWASHPGQRRSHQTCLGLAGLRERHDSEEGLVDGNTRIALFNGSASTSKFTGIIPGTFSTTKVENPLTNKTARFDDRSLGLVSAFTNRTRGFTWDNQYALGEGAPIAQRPLLLLEPLDPTIPRKPPLACRDIHA
jgi:hypothetical protein